MAVAVSRAEALLAPGTAVANCAGIRTLVLVSDGRATIALARGDPYADALAQARALQAAGVAPVFVDTDGPIRLGLARTVAVDLGATSSRLEGAKAQRGIEF